MDVLSTREREVAYEVANHAMISGWDQAIGWYASKYQVPQMDIRVILDKAVAYNQKADPSGRIPELNDWLNEQRNRSTRSQSSRLHLLSPGLRNYMENKLNKAK